MANQIVLAWRVRVAGTTLGPAQAAAKLAAVPLYTSQGADPVLGQLFGLTVSNDQTTQDAVSATRTLTLNMTSAVGAPLAPPPFPCRPDSATPPTLPITLRRKVALAGEFTPTTGSTIVPTSANQAPSLAHLDVVEFQSQLGVYYTVNTVSPTSVKLFAAFSGRTGSATAAKVEPAPAAIPALYSTSPLDTAGVATVPAIPAGSGARAVSLTYRDSTGAGPFTVVTPLTGKRPAAVALAAGSVDVESIVDLHVASVGGFGNSVGQVTLADLASALPPVPSDATPVDFQRLTDEAQLLIDRALAYLPPSYFALAQQGASQPALAGDFSVTTGSATVPTSEDQTGALAPGNEVQFAVQQDELTPFGAVPVTYTVATVTPKYVTLTAPFTGLDPTPKTPDTGAKGTKSAQLSNFATAARLVNPSPAAPPTAAQLEAPMAQFVNPGDAVPPPDPPLSPETMSPAPTLLSGIYTQALQLALAVPVEPQPIALV